VVNARNYAAAPVFTPLPFGLLATFADELRSDVDGHWQNGITYEPLCGVSSTTYEKCFSVTGAGFALAPTPPPKVATASLSTRGATPFTVFTEVDCSANGFWDRAETLVGAGLNRTEQLQVERAFWTGVAGGRSVVWPHLAANAIVLDETNITIQTAATTVSGGAAVTYDVVEGIGRLEAEIGACYDGVPTLHVPLVLLEAFAANMMLIRDGNRYRTPAGSIVVFGAGYPGTAPDGSAPPVGTTWVYATGAMVIYRGNLRVIPRDQSIDRAENTVKAIAERTYVIGWDCCHFGARISTGGVVSGAAGAP